MSRPVLYLLPGLLCDARIWGHQIATLGDIADIRVADLRGYRSIEAMAEGVLAEAPARFGLAGVGRRDLWSPVAQHEFIASRIPGATLSIFENCGHMAPAEAGPAVSAALRDWLTH